VTAIIVLGKPVYLSSNADDHVSILNAVYSSPRNLLCVQMNQGCPYYTARNAFFYFFFIFLSETGVLSSLDCMNIGQNLPCLPRRFKYIYINCQSIGHIPYDKPPSQNPSDTNSEIFDRVK